MVATFPAVRMRRLRKTEPIRRLVRETTLTAGDFVYPMFVVPGRGVREEIATMPGCFHVSADEAVREAEEALGLGVPGVMLFGLPLEKDALGTGAYAEEGVVQDAVRALKSALPELVVITDVCLCEYTDHGHCGVIVNEDVDNDASLELIAKTALSHAQAGADIVAPSDMMDGRVGVIRSVLDENGLPTVPIISYAAKYASAFTGPFRVAADSTPQFGDRRGYQMDPANAREALLEMELDVEEGADILMVKPALAYLDILARARAEFKLPLAAYNVSGEYVMVKAAARNGWLDEERVVLESLIGIKRAGADIIMTYHAKDAARWLTGGGVG
jgi:porphobilinogen synthase